MSSEQQTPIFGGKAAFILGSVMLVGFAVLSLTAALDRRDRATLEKLDNPSAAGDAVVYRRPETPPAPGEPPVPVLASNGVLLFDRGEEKYSDGTMIKAGMDDAGKIPLYKRMRRNKPKDDLYLKLAPGRYMELGPAKVPKKKAVAAESETR